MPFEKSSEVEYNVLKYLLIFSYLCKMTCVQKLENSSSTLKREMNEKQEMVYLIS